MSSNCNDSYRCRARIAKLSTILVISIFTLLPTQGFATSGIASRVAAACAPDPTMPDVGSCSACHSTTNNRGPNDLTAAGQWSLSPATYNLFCQTSTTPPPDTTPPPVTPTPPPGMSPTTPTPGMGRGSGGSRDDDDDDDERDDDDDMEDDDDDGGSSASRSLRSRLEALRSQFRRRSRD
ncbi:MAG: hypothetical protein P8Y28_00500 [Gammaproteobacteria bacterium]|jgi:hypothetical protein